MPLSSVIAISGPQKIVEKIKLPEGMFDRVHKFYCPDDVGEFPDTSGYTADNWENISSSMEDSFLWPHMQKCMDAVMDFVLQRGDTLDKLGMMNIKSDINWPRFGGKVFAVCGFIGWEAPPNKLGKGIVIN